VVLGPIADQVAGEIRARLAEMGAAPPAPVAAPVTAQQPAQAAQAPADPAQVAGLLELLGGAGNVLSVEARASRILVTVADGAVVDERAAPGLGLRGLARTGANVVHVVLGPSAASPAEALQRLLPQGG